MLKISLYRLFIASLLQFSVVNCAFAFDSDMAKNWNFGIKQTAHEIQFGSVQYSQNERANLRSRSDVIQEVKQRYNAEVLKVTLDERQQMYRVRVLMPNGKVRNLKISARR